MPASAVEPYDFPDTVCHPDVGDVDVKTPRLLPQVVPVVNVYHVEPLRTRSGSGASSANAGLALVETVGAITAGAGAAAGGIQAEPNAKTSPPRSSIQYPLGAPDESKLGVMPMT